MEYNKIREYLDRYWEGTSTLEEEEALRSFFSRDIVDLPEDLKEAQPLFRYFAEEADIPVPEFPELDLAAFTAAIADGKRAAGDVQARPVRQFIWQHWMKYAAMLLMALGIGYGVRQADTRQRQVVIVFSGQDTYDDPEKALAVTKKALALLSRNLNKGTTQMQKLTYFSDATEKIKAN